MRGLPVHTDDRIGVRGRPFASPSPSGEREFTGLHRLRTRFHNRAARRAPLTTPATTLKCGPVVKYLPVPKIHCVWPVQEIPC